MNQGSPNKLPLIIAGPMLRHVDCKVITFWLMTSQACTPDAHIINQNGEPLSIDNEQIEREQLQLGTHCFIHLLKVAPREALKNGHCYGYDMSFHAVDSNANIYGYDNDAHQTLQSDEALHLHRVLPHLFEPGETHIPFYFTNTLTKVAHGSCRKAHFDGKDALATLDEVTLKSIKNCTADATAQCPDILLLTGDQVYVDDVAGPMLYATHQVVSLLGLFHESFEDSTIGNSEELFEHEHSFYERDLLFPQVDANEDLAKAFIGGKRKPVFTSVNAQNHLIALNEMIALYILSWSGRLWPQLTLKKPDIADEHLEKYVNETKLIEQFTEGLVKVERVLSRVPSYMIFDDHDVTDDWNLTRAWEEQVYGNAFSKRIIGNAITAYFLCQGLGNPIEHIRPLIEDARRTFKEGELKHEEFIERLFEFSHWHYQLNTSPPVQVLDTRTQRWRSESNKHKPSGLMDWEALCELQQNIIGKDAVILVSAAPVYGVKFIETIQKVFTIFGGALLVDAENWMAHRGTASVMLNIFRHINTPPNFIILSGDVHYSFVYDVNLRFRKNSPKILQFTCSGMHNEFPDKLLTWFERLNRWFYGYRSPLNWLTKRRNMQIKERHPEGSPRDIINACAYGVLNLDKDGNETSCKVVCADGREVVFKPPQQSE